MRCLVRLFSSSLGVARLESMRVEWLCSRRLHRIMLDGEGDPAVTSTGIGVVWKLPLLEREGASCALIRYFLFWSGGCRPFVAETLLAAIRVAPHF